MMRRFAAFLARLWRDRGGNYSMIVVLLMPVLAGFVGMGTEVGMWFYTHQSMQGAADAAAFSAAAALKAQEPVTNQSQAVTNAESEADAVAASYGFTTVANCSVSAPATSTSCVLINNPPLSGSQAGKANAFEVYIAQSPQRLFSKLLITSPVVISARAVGVMNSTTTVGGTAPQACIVALGSTNQANTVEISGATTITLANCNLAIDSTASSNSGYALTLTGTAALNANVTLASSSSATGGTVNGTVTAGYKTANPYTLPSTASVSCASAVTESLSRGTTTLNPGTYNSLTVAGATVTLNPGIYYICPGNGATPNSIAVSSGTLKSATGGVTIVLLGSGASCAQVNFSGGTVNLQASTANPTTPAGYTGLIFANAATANGTSACTPPGPLTAQGNQAKLSGGATMTLTGAIDLVGYNVAYSGASNSSGCTQLIADTITLSGTSGLGVNCTGDGTQTINAGAGSSTTTYATALVE